jgi:hypothetical protein
MRRRLAVLGLVAALAGAARAQTQPAPLPAAPAVAPAVRGAVVLEPDRIRAGDVAALEIVVTTPPGHRLLPIVLPTELPGFWILDAETLAVEKQEGRWIHRTRVRLRARELGQFVWPAQPVEIEAPGGTLQRLALDGRPLEVVSVQPDFPGRDVPFGLRELPGALPARGSAWGAAAAGALAGGALVALVGLMRRVRRRRGAQPVELSTAASGSALSPWRAASLALDGIAAHLGAEPVPATDALARTLRSYATQRWRRDVSALTTPELAAMTPPAEAARHWPALLELLRSLDDARFLPGTVAASQSAARARDVLARVRAFVAATTPPGARD